MLGAASVDVGPFAPIEQAVLAEAVTPARRNVAFARYALSAGLAAAAGGVVASLATDPGRIGVFFLAYAAIGLALTLIPFWLSPAVEARQVQAEQPARLRPLLGLSALFALDSLGGGFVIQAVIAYWLHVRFGAGPSVLGPAFAAIAILQAISYEVSGRLANRIGLVRTMVFTHLPSNLLLMLVPLMPTLPLALAVLLARFSISQMDVPARQAYVVSIVPPSERAGAAAVTGAVRSLAQAAGPSLAGIAIQTAAFGIPFYIAAGLKIAYDLLLYAGFRRRAAEHEAPRTK
jgi:predicted MFS family arabinose efflux permease